MPQSFGKMQTQHFAGARGSSFSAAVSSRLSSALCLIFRKFLGTQVIKAMRASCGKRFRIYRPL
jgi:hypothetical protein